MKAIILAAGFGVRMKPLTDRCPKPLLPVLGRPIIDYTISRVKTFGIKEVGVNICHLADKMEKFLGDGSRWGVALTFPASRRFSEPEEAWEVCVRFLKEKDHF